MRTEIPTIYNLIKEEFDSALKNAEGDYVDRPKSLSSYGKKKYSEIRDAKSTNSDIKAKVLTQTQELIKLYSLPSIVAMDIVLQSMDIEERLKQEGVVFGKEAFNFSITRPELTQEQQSKITTISIAAVNALSMLGKSKLDGLIPTMPMNPVEQEFESLNMVPNAARIDIIMTPQGPKIIEINSQWVDAIGALDGFQRVSGRSNSGTPPFKELAKSFPPDTRLAIINVQQTTGSRELGAQLELENLAKKLTGEGRILEAEVLNPNKVNLDYLMSFNAFYVNCDPKYFINSSPEWIRKVIERAKINPKCFFPSWRPLLDKKILLAELSNRSSNANAYLRNQGVDIQALSQSFIPTIPLTELSQDILNSGYPIVIKGDGYSLNSVAISTQPGFADFLRYAQEEENAYTVQPFVESTTGDYWVYDTGSKTIKLIENAYTKINVWVINGKVVGTLMTISDTPYISDKGYNAIPLIRKDGK